MEEHTHPRGGPRALPTGLNFKGYLAALSPDELNELANLMRELEDQPGWQALVKLLEEARGRVHEALEITPTLPQAEYSRAAGMAGVTRQIVLLPSHVVQAAEKKREQAERSARPDEGETT